MAVLDVVGEDSFAVGALLQVLVGVENEERSQSPP